MPFPGHETVSIGNRVRVNEALGSQRMDGSFNESFVEGDMGICGVAVLTFF